MMIMELKWQRLLTLEHRVYCRVTQDAGMTLEQVKNKIMEASLADSFEELPEVATPIARSAVPNAEARGLLISRDAEGNPMLVYRRYRYVIAYDEDSQAIQYLTEILEEAGDIFASVQLIATRSADIGPQ
jgi:hypothetical protein